MDRNTIIAATVAAAIHSGLLFGFNRGPAPTPPPKPIEPRNEILIMPNPEPPEPDIVVAAAPQGSPEQIVPRSADTPSVETAVFNLPVDRLPPVDVTNVASISSVPLGVPDGIGDALQNFVVGTLALDNPPRTRTQVAPEYPFQAKSSGRTGEVMVEFVVDEGGRVLQPRVVRSSDRVFEEPTLRAVQRWRFEPGRVQGQVVRFRMAVPVVFNLHEH